MENTSWLKQTLEKPLFPDILWSRPENKRHAGKLLIIGGNSHGFATVANSYSSAGKAGIGEPRILLPDVLQKTVGKLFPEASFAASTPSGSFSRQALAQLLDESEWADGVLLAGDFGHNSETAILLESFWQKYSGQLTICGDGLDSSNRIIALAKRSTSLIVCDVPKLQKLAAGTALIKNSMDLNQMVAAITSLSKDTKLSFVTAHSDHIIVSVDGITSTTAARDYDLAVIAAYSSVWWLQQPGKPFEAITSAVLEARK